MVLDGFFDRFRDLRLIAAHAGAALPYLAGRLDMCHARMPAARARVSDPPSAYLRRIWYDSIAYTPDALALCLKVAGPDRVMFGSDYPHNIGDPEGLLALLDDLPAEARDAVRGGTARRVFGL